MLVDCIGFNCAVQNITARIR